MKKTGRKGKTERVMGVRGDGKKRRGSTKRGFGEKKEKTVKERKEITSKERGKWKEKVRGGREGSDE